MEPVERIRAFDSVDEMMAHMKAEEDAANAATHPKQRSIGYGEYVIRPLAELLVFGYVQEEAERNEGEDEYTITLLDQSHERGYRTGLWYSEVCVDGEPGSAHIATLWRIYKEEFDAAQMLGWETKLIVREPWFLRMMGRIQEEIAHTGGATTDRSEPRFVEVEPNLEDPDDQSSA